MRDHLWAGLLAAACFVQAGVRVFGMPVGPADILLGAVFPAWGLGVVRRFRLSGRDIPPWYVSACIAAVVVSGTVYALLGGAGKGALKEELQAIEVLGVGWIAAGFLLRGKGDTTLFFFRVLGFLLGIEAAAVLVRGVAGDDLFCGGIFTRNRNTYALAAAAVSPLLAFLAFRAARLFEKVAWAGLLCTAWSAVTSLGALPAAAAGLALLAPRTRKRALLAWGVLPVLAGVGIALLRPGTREALIASTAFAPRENHLVKGRDLAYMKKKEAYIEENERWFSAGTAVRYRRWRYAALHVASSVRRLLVGSGPSTFNDALKPRFLRDGKPNIDTDEVMMFNLGVNEPDTFSAYAVWAVENGLPGLLVLVLFFTIPVVRGMRGGKGPRRAAAGALAAVAVGDVFFSHMITGTYLLVVCLVRIAAGGGEAVPGVSDDER